MNDIKQVSDWALTIAAEAAGSKLHHYERMADDNRLAQSIEAHARAIEQHEAFRQEVSDAVEDYCGYVPPDSPCHPITRFIIAKPDPLVEVWEDMLRDSKPGEDRLEVFRAALAARGLKIVEDK